jgi:hypothetical protein
MLDVGDKLSGDMLAIARHMQFYIPEKHSMVSPQTGIERQLENVNTEWWGAHTSNIVGLFLNKRSALACSKKDNLVRYDPRWREKTRAVLKKIGENHPTITICHYPRLRLINPRI